MDEICFHLLDGPSADAVQAVAGRPRTGAARRQRSR
jgi:hypothetical protein